MTPLMVKAKSEGLLERLEDRPQHLDLCCLDRTGEGRIPAHLDSWMWRKQTSELTKKESFARHTQGNCRGGPWCWRGARTGGAQAGGRLRQPGNRDPEWSAVRSGDSERVRERDISEAASGDQSPRIQIYAFI